MRSGWESWTKGPGPWGRRGLSVGRALKPPWQHLAGQSTAGLGNDANFYDLWTSRIPQPALPPPPKTRPAHWLKLWRWEGLSWGPSTSMGQHKTSKALPLHRSWVPEPPHATPIPTLWGPSLHRLWGGNVLAASRSSTHPRGGGKEALKGHSPRWRRH